MALAFVFQSINSFWIVHNTNILHRPILKGPVLTDDELFSPASNIILEISFSFITIEFFVKILVSFVVNSRKFALQKILHRKHQT